MPNGQISFQMCTWSNLLLHVRVAKPLSRVAWPPYVSSRSLRSSLQVSSRFDCGSLHRARRRSWRRVVAVRTSTSSAVRSAIRSSQCHSLLASGLARVVARIVWPHRSLASRVSSPRWRSWRWLRDRRTEDPARQWAALHNTSDVLKRDIWKTCFSQDRQPTSLWEAELWRHRVHRNPTKPSRTIGTQWERVTSKISPSKSFCWVPF